MRNKKIKNVVVGKFGYSAMILERPKGSWVYTGRQKVGQEHFWSHLPAPGVTIVNQLLNYFINKPIIHVWELINYR